MVKKAYGKFAIVAPGEYTLFQYRSWAVMLLLQKSFVRLEGCVDFWIYAIGRNNVTKLQKIFAGILAGLFKVKGTQV